MKPNYDPRSERTINVLEVVDEPVELLVHQSERSILVPVFLASTSKSVAEISLGVEHDSEIKSNN